MEAVMEEPRKKKETFIDKLVSKPLFKQSIKANWVYWLVLTLGVAAIFIIINIVIGSKKIFTNIDIAVVSSYVRDEGLDWLKILGLLEAMGFKLSRIQVMSSVDLNSVVNDLVYRIAGVILPMIYVMGVSNKLISSQVSEGSMAYVLSTPTNRKKVVRTQFIFLVLSLICMYIIITASAVLSETIANALLTRNYPDVVVNPSELPYRLLRSMLYCGASFLAIFTLAGVCFGASCFFTKNSTSVAIGGGVCVISFIACILGLFGNKIFVAVGVGVESMNFFNYMSIFTLIDTESMANFVKGQLGYEGSIFTPSCFNWIYECIAMLVGGALFSFIGMFRFKGKDLPL